MRFVREADVTRFEGVTDPALLTQMGVCDVCGEPATQFARDVYVETPFDKPWEKKLTGGPLKRGCEEHTPKSRRIVLDEGPFSYDARMRVAGKW